MSFKTPRKGVKLIPSASESSIIPEFARQLTKGLEQRFFQEATPTSSSTPLKPVLFNINVSLDPWQPENIESESDFKDSIDNLKGTSATGSSSNKRKRRDTSASSPDPVKWSLHLLGEGRQVHAQKGAPYKNSDTVLSFESDGVVIPGISVLLEEEVKAAHLRFIDVAGDGNCGFRAMWEILVDHGVREDGQPGIAVPRRHRQNDGYHIAIRRELSSWFTSHKVHYMSSTFVKREDGDFDTLLEQLKKPATDKADEDHWMNSTLHVPLFCDRYQVMVLCCYGSTEKVLYLHTPTRSKTQFENPRSRVHNHPRTLLKDTSVGFYGLWLADGHCQYWQFDDTMELRNWVREEVDKPEGIRKVHWQGHRTKARTKAREDVSNVGR